MNTTRLTNRRLLVLSIVLSGGIFAIDLSLPLAVAGGGHPPKNGGAERP